MTLTHSDISSLQRARTIETSEYTSTFKIGWKTQDTEIEFGSNDHKLILSHSQRLLNTVLNRNSIIRYDFFFSVSLENSTFANNRQVDKHIISSPSDSIHFLNESFDDMINLYLDFLHESGYDSTIQRFYGLSIRATNQSYDFAAYSIPYKSYLPTSITKYQYIPENTTTNDCFNLCLTQLQYPVTVNNQINSTEDIIKSKLKNIRLLKLNHEKSESKSKSRDYKSYVIFKTPFDETFSDDYFNIVIIDGTDILNFSSNKKEKATGLKARFAHCAALVQKKGFFDSETCHKCLTRLNRKTKQCNNGDNCLSANKSWKPMYTLNNRFTCRKKLPKCKTYNRYFIAADTETNVQDPNNHKLVVGKAALIDMGELNSNNSLVLDQILFTDNKSFLTWVEQVALKVNMFYQRFPLLPCNQPGVFHKINDKQACFLCEEPFTEGELEGVLFEDTKQIIHHDHSLAPNHPDQIFMYCHQSCNINEGKNARSLPILFHNSNYDYFATSDATGKAMFNTIVDFFKKSPKGLEYDENIIGSNFQSIKSLTYTMKTESKKKLHVGAFTLKIEFKDWTNFMKQSLESIGSDMVKATQKDVFPFPLFQQMRQLNQATMKLSTGKGKFPYTLLTTDTYNNFNEIPDRKYFYDDLNDTPVTDEDYQRVLDAYTALGTTSFKEYTNYYLDLDVAILAQSITNLVKSVFKSEHFNMQSFTGAPGMAETFVLREVEKQTSFPLQSLDIPEVMQFVNESVVGGLSKTFAKEAKASKSNHNLYFDVNSMYPSVQSMYPSPISINKFCENPNHIDLNMILNTPNDFELGYFVDINCEINRDSVYCNKPNSFLPLPENLDIKAEHVDPIQYKYISKSAKANRRLTTTFLPKVHYKMHYIALKKYVELGVIKNVTLNSYVSFIQSTDGSKPATPVFSDCMNGLRTKRIKVRKQGNETLGDFYKLVMNSFFGKTIESEKASAKNFSTIQNQNLSYKVQKGNFIDYKPLSNDHSMLCVRNNNLQIKSNKFIGATILSLAKMLLFQHVCSIQDFCIKKGYTFDPLYTDTDSIIFSINTGETIQTSEPGDSTKLFKELFEEPDLQTVLDIHGSKEFGLLNSETKADDTIVEFYGISSKCYAYKTRKGSVVLKGKGVPSRLLKQKITIEDYARCAHNYEFVTKLKYCEFVKVNMILKTDQTTKVALTNSDLKSKAVKNPQTGYVSLENIGWSSSEISSI